MTGGKFRPVPLPDRDRGLAGAVAMPGGELSRSDSWARRAQSARPWLRQLGGRVDAVQQGGGGHTVARLPQLGKAHAALDCGTGEFFVDGQDDALCPRVRAYRG